MMAARQLGQMVTDALAEANPARLIELAESRSLVTFLAEKIQAFKLQFVRAMEGQPKAAEPTVTEGLLPMLVKFPTASNKPTLTPQQQQLVTSALDQYEATTYPDSQASRGAPISD